MVFLVSFSFMVWFLRFWLISDYIVDWYSYGLRVQADLLISGWFSWFLTDFLDHLFSFGFVFLASGWSLANFFGFWLLSECLSWIISDQVLSDLLVSWLIIFLALLVSHWCLVLGWSLAVIYETELIYLLYFIEGHWLNGRVSDHVL